MGGGEGRVYVDRCVAGVVGEMKEERKAAVRKVHYYIYYIYFSFMSKSKSVYKLIVCILFLCLFYNLYLPEEDPLGLKRCISLFDF